MKTLLSAFIVVVMCFCNALAIETPNVVGEKVETIKRIKNNEIVKTVVSESHNKYEISRIAMERDLLVAHNKDLIDIVKWSLGFVAVFLVGFLGMVGFFNVRRLSQDKEAMISIIEKELIEIKSGLDSDYSKIKVGHNDLEAKLSDSIKEQTIHMIEKIEDKSRDSQKEIISVVNAVVDSRDKALTEKIEKLGGDLVAINRKLRSLKLDIKTENIERGIGYWELKQVEDNQLSGWFDFVAVHAERGESDWAIGHGLEKILELLGMGAQVSSFFKGKYLKELDNLPNTFASEAQKIKEKM